MQFIDTHVHLTYPDFGDIGEVITRAKEVGVTRFVSPGLDFKSSEQVIALAKSYPEIIPGIGLHPLGEAEELAPYADLAKLPEVKAIGEIGTDRNAGPMEDQEKRLRFFLDLAVQTEKPALIHIRETWDETFQILADYPQLRGKAVIHCFTGTKKEASKMRELGLLMSVTAILARKNMSPETLEAVKEWPLDQMMLETDGPYLAWPGEKWPNEPSTVAKVAQFIAELKGVSIEEVAERTTQTAERFFNLK
ncbi:MAG TPA: TatD family hydrolase [Patescibacteria group bacterium]